MAVVVSGNQKVGKGAGCVVLTDHLRRGTSSPTVRLTRLVGDVAFTASIGAYYIVIFSPSLIDHLGKDPDQGAKKDEENKNPLIETFNDYCFHY